MSDTGEKPGGKLLILDADGVFFSERPYWDTALATGLMLHGVGPTTQQAWQSIADTAFGPLGLHRVAKRHGCNSNWDLAAVIDLALARSEGRLAALIREGNDHEAMDCLRDLADGLWSSRDTDGDPLQQFGIDRTSERYGEVFSKFQHIFLNPDCLPWRFERYALECEQTVTSDVFESLLTAGWQLRVCTGRPRPETEAPIAELGIGDFFSSEQLTTCSEVEQAQERTGMTALGKPHWFAPVCAAVGFEAAMNVFDSAPLTTAYDRVVYVGDSPSDFEAIVGARTMGLNSEYVHVLSPVAEPDLITTITTAELTVGVIASIAELPSLLEGDL